MSTRIKILVRKNLKMSEGKIAAQAVHAALGLAKLFPTASDPMLSVVVLFVTDKKFDENRTALMYDSYVQTDAGYTEVPPGTETCMAFLERPKE